MKTIIRQANWSSSLRIMFMLLAGLVMIGTAEAATYTVTNTNDSGGGTLREAISLANGTVGVADTIEFQAGLSGTITLASALPTVTDELTINGPGAGVLTVSGASAFQVLSIATGVTASISGLTISNGLAGIGGGISNQRGTLTVTNSTFSNNSATLGGGISNANGGTLTVTNSTFSNNSVSVGGGIYNANGGTLTVTNSTFSGNSALASGGSICNSLGTTRITGSTFSGNSALANGGGILNNFGSAMTITNSTISSNSAMNGGGIINGGAMTITNSTISGNSAAIYGGGIYNADTLRITSSTFSGNSANYGGGNGGGGIFNQTITSNQATAIVKNSIIANSPTGGNCGGGTPITALGVNFSTDATCAGFTQVTPAELNLGPLADNGGPTQTHALLAGSVAIDAVTDPTDQSDPPVAVATDQRGVNRPQGPASDAGAFELDAPPAICPQPQGYWKNNPAAWPISSLTLGGETYTQAELLAILNTPVGTGKSADASLILADQLIAARLNLANGSDPTPVSATVTAADALLATFSGKLPYLVKPASTVGQQMTALAALLDQYNNGLLTGCAP